MQLSKTKQTKRAINVILEKKKKTKKGGEEMKLNRSKNQNSALN
jgi:hypothetical protein